MNIVRKILTVTFLFSLVTNGSAKDKIRLSTGEWPPYISEKLKHYGVGSHIVVEAFDSMGVEVEIKFLPWKRAYETAKSGGLEGTLLWAKSSQREEDFLFSEIIFEDKLVFFHLKAYPFDWNTMDDLTKLDIGGTIGYDYGELFMEAEKSGKIKVHRVPKDSQSFRKLLHSRINIFPLERDPGYAVLQDNFKSEEIELITFHPKSLKDHTYHLLLSKEIPKNKRLLFLFNQGLKKLKASGKIEQYLAASRKGKYKKSSTTK